MSKKKIVFVLLVRIITILCWFVGMPMFFIPHLSENWQGVMKFVCLFFGVVSFLSLYQFIKSIPSENK